VDAKGARLVARLVVPDDAQALVGLRRAERVRCACRPELGRCAGLVAPFSLRDADLGDRLSLSEWDLAEGAAEVAREVEGNDLVDDQAAVCGDLDDDVRARQREGLGGRVSGEDERRGNRRG